MVVGLGEPIGKQLVAAYGERDEGDASHEYDQHSEDGQDGKHGDDRGKGRRPNAAERGSETRGRVDALVVLHAGQLGHCTDVEGYGDEQGRLVAFGMCFLPSVGTAALVHMAS